MTRPPETTGDATPCSNGTCQTTFNVSGSVCGTATPAGTCPSRAGPRHCVQSSAPQAPQANTTATSASNPEIRFMLSVQAVSSGVVASATMSPFPRHTSPRPESQPARVAVGPKVHATIRSKAGFTAPDAPSNPLALPRSRESRTRSKAPAYPPSTSGCLSSARRPAARVSAAGSAPRASRASRPWHR